MRFPIATLALILLLPSRSLHAQERRVPERWTAFAEFFDTAARADSVVGASVALIEDGRVTRHHEFGFADRAQRIPVSERTIFHWGSITKGLTAIGIMQLRDRGRLTLDDPVTRYIPELRMVHNPFGSMDAITIRMLLSHTAGFQNPTWPYKQGKPWEPFEPTTWNQLVAMMPYQEIHFAPGSKYGYSNPAFIYLGRIIEQLSGDPWEAYVQKNILAPLALSHSYFGLTPPYLAADRSNNYTVARDSSGASVVHDNGRDFDPGITIPNGGWNAPLTDLAAYMTFLTGATGTDATQRTRFDTVLRRPTLEEMWRPGQPMSATAPPTEWMGMSFFVLDVQGTRLIGHTGSQAGFLAFFYLNPANKKAVIAAFNTASDDDSEGRKSAFSQIRDRALELLR